MRSRMSPPTRSTAFLFAVIASLAVAVAPVSVYAQADSEATSNKNTELAASFNDFLHYARLGRFTEAEAFGQKLLQTPDLDTEVLLKVADKDKQAVPTLITLIRHTSLNETAQKILDLIREGEFKERQETSRIRTNVEKLGGPPQMEFNAIQRLKASGEYAVPELVDALRDPAHRDLWPRIIRALPQIGKPAVGPLVVALDVDDADIRRNLVWALGEIGYPQALPYLQALLLDDSQSARVKDAATEAIEAIWNVSDRRLPDSAADAFVRLGTQYYYEHGSVSADPRLDAANVWFWEGGALIAKQVPTEIFGSVMAMRATEEALLLQPERQDAIALWLASDFRREARLGMDVESTEADAGGDADSTRPDAFPRSIYFARAAGPEYCHMVLGRAVGDVDKPVALGALAALEVVAGASSLVGNESYKQPLVQALRFPDAEVRIKAAIALARALPKEPFAGSDIIGHVLAEGLRQEGRAQYVVIDPDVENLNRVANEMRELGADVVAEQDFLAAMDRARRELGDINGFIMSTDIKSPPVANAMQQLRGEFRFARTPVVLMASRDEAYRAEQVLRDASSAASIDAVMGGPEIRAAIEEIAQGDGTEPLETDLALELALRSADALRLVALDGQTVIDYTPAIGALIAGLNAEDQGLRVRCAQVLALIRTQPGQQAIARVALTEDNNADLRIAAFDALAESAKRFGNQLAPDQVKQVVQAAKATEDLTMRTAASQALGALNLQSGEASEIIRSYHQG